MYVVTLMVEYSGEHRKYILSALNSFTIGNFYVRKNQPRGYRYGKAPGCKEYFTAHQLAKKCRKKGYDSIYDRYIRDKLFRGNMIDHGRTEKIIIDMDNLANENRSSKVTQNEIDYYRQNWWVHSNVVHEDKRDNPANKARIWIQRSVVNNATPEASGRQEEAGHNITPFFILVFMAMAVQLVGIRLRAFASKMGLPLKKTRGNPYEKWSTIYWRSSSTYRRNSKFFFGLSVTADSSLRSPTVGVEVSYTTPHIYEQKTAQTMATSRTCLSTTPTLACT